MAGVNVTCPTGRWEAGLDVGAFSDVRRAVFYVPILAGPAKHAEEHRVEVWHTRLRGGALTPVSTHGFMRGWLPRIGVLRAGGGLAIIRTLDRVSILGATVGPGFNHATSETIYLRPMLDAGLRLPISRRISLDVGIEWIADVQGPLDANFGGPGASARLMF